MAKSFGATLSLKDGNFFTNLKSAMGATEQFKQKLGGTQTTIGKTSKSLQGFGGDLKDIASDFLKTATVLTGVKKAFDFGKEIVTAGTEFKKASNSIITQAGLSKESISGFNNVLKEIYADNFGENFEDIANSISTVAQTSRTLDPSYIKEMTENAITLRDTFGFDIQESMRASNMLMDQFGVTGTEAFNLIVQGAQSGLNKNGDLLDSINEYSVHFKQLGIGAEGMFNAFANGAFSGTFSVDKLGEAVQEFGIRVKDGTGDEAFKTLGLSANNMKKAFTQGGEAGQKAFEQVTQKLFAMQDPVKQNTLGVQLFGTTWEDLGKEGIKALSDITGEFDKTYDAMNQVKNVQYNDVGSALEGLKRTLVSNIVLPISENITPAVGDAVNRLREAFGDGGPLSGMADAFGGKLSQAIKKTVDLMAGAAETGKNIYQKISPSLGKLKESFRNIKDSIVNAFNSRGTSFIQKISDVAIPGLCNALSFVMDTISGVISAIKPLTPVIAGVIGGIAAYKSLSGIVGVITGISSAVKLFSKAFTAFKSASSILKSFGAAGKVLSKGTGAIKGIGSAFTFLSSGVGIAVVVIGAAIAAGVLLYKNWDTIKQWALNLWEGIKNIFGGIRDSIVGAWDTVKNKASSICDGIKTTVSEKFNAVKDTIGTVMDAAKNVASEKLSNIKAAYEEHGGGIKGTVYAAMEGVKGYYTAGYDFLNQITGGKLGELVAKVGDKLNLLREKFQIVKDKIVEIWGGLVDGIKGAVNSVFGVINKLIGNFENGINSIIGGVNVMVTKMGFNAIPTVNLPKIPMLANGGTVTRPGRVLVGEKGPEFLDLPQGARVTPLSKSGAKTTNNTFYVTIYADGKSTDEMAGEFVEKVKLAMSNM